MDYCEEQALCGSYCVRWDQCFWCQRYQSGQAKPNYPMPAIMYEASIDRDAVDMLIVGLEPDKWGVTCELLYYWEAAD